MEIEKVFINENFDGLLICPHCKKRKLANFSTFRDSKRRTLKVKCTCESHFRILIDFRRSHRKKTNLDGAYTKLSDSKVKGKMQVLNLSVSGIGFITRDLYVLSLGDRVRIRFTLDDQKQSEIEKESVVRTVKGNYVGCKFTNPSQYEKVLRFYLMP